MSDRSAIQWTDASWNPVRGCTKVSVGCRHCYAETFAERFRGVKGHPYEQGFDVRLVPGALDLPLHWKKPRRVFVNSMSDLFHEDVPSYFIAQVFHVMTGAPQHTFQVLTKRARRMREFFQSATGRIHAMPFEEGKPLPNVWLGVSCEDQAAAGERIPHLVATPGAVRFVSCEPLLGPVDLSRWLLIRDTGYGSNGWELSRSSDGRAHPLLDWVIVGGESGLKARPCDVAWIRSIIEQCRAAGVPAFVKQDFGLRAGRQGRIPDDLWIKEFPNGHP